MNSFSVFLFFFVFVSTYFLLVAKLNTLFLLIIYSIFSSSTNFLCSRKFDCCLFWFDTKFPHTETRGAFIYDQNHHKKNWIRTKNLNALISLFSLFASYEKMASNIVVDRCAHLRSNHEMFRWKQNVKTKKKLSENLPILSFWFFCVEWKLPVWECFFFFLFRFQICSIVVGYCCCFRYWNSWFAFNLFFMRTELMNFE